MCDSKEGWLKDAHDLLSIQGDHGNWDYDGYMHGMYNGMEIIIALAEGREPKFRDTPPVFIREIVKQPFSIQMQREEIEAVKQQRLSSPWKVYALEHYTQESCVKFWIEQIADAELYEQRWHELQNEADA